AIPPISCVSCSRKRPRAGAGVGAGTATRTPQRSSRRGGTRAWCDGILGTPCTSSRRTTPCRRANGGRALGWWPPCAPSRSSHGAYGRTSRRTRRPRPIAWRSCAPPRPTSKPSSCSRRTPTGCWRRPSPSGPPACRRRAPNSTASASVWVVSGDEAAELARLAGRAQLYIADGHHRYETAVAYTRERASADRVLSFIVSAADPGLTILPTHRVIFGAGRDATKLVAAWREWFEVGRVAPCMDRVERLAELGRERTACIVAFPDAYDVTLVLKHDARLDIPELGKTPAVR